MKRGDAFSKRLRARISELKRSYKICRSQDKFECENGGTSDFYDESQRLAGAIVELYGILDQYVQFLQRDRNTRGKQNE